jgi:hypothetical protein
MNVDIQRVGLIKKIFRVSWFVSTDVVTRVALFRQQTRKENMEPENSVIQFNSGMNFSL